jgi:hypothetical protein
VSSLALSVGVGLSVLAELMDEEVDEVVGSKGRHDSERTAVRHGHEEGSVTLGGRRVPVARPRVRSAEGASEVALQTYAHYADRDATIGWENSVPTNPTTVGSEHLRTPPVRAGMEIATQIQRFGRSGAR